MVSFFDTVGLVPNGVLRGGLLYKRWPVEWYRSYLSPLVQAEPEQSLLCDICSVADNRGWLAGEAAAWTASSRSRARWLSFVADCAAEA